ncbi:hypothetical protein AZE42_01477 [Rhizopogon vesiculosus]|uniref:F-box domain-containing protein n=1 Tax=Rhizopogon vesiculosus TaxID=180088 RepID=A0A1J8PLI0_9AGAM|nr:hypothetical protein AZE42_01477 [Rhizopogon vesiculosus]
MASRTGDQTDEEDSDTQAGLAPNRVRRAIKRPRSSADDAKPSKKLRRRGRLDLMPTMNLDILFHILSFLSPMDLLNLSRTTKDFRNLLLHSSSARAWKDARLQVEGLPDCPLDMSEPQYANLAFYPHCHDCDRVVRTVSWALRARYCPKCLTANTVDQFGRGRFEDTDLYFLRFLPWVREQGRYHRPLYLTKALDELLVEHSKTPEDERTALLDKKKKHAGDVMRHAEQCQYWSKSIATSRKYELNDIRRNRKDAIIARLTEAGYKPELDYGAIFWLQQQEKALFRAKILTTKEWDRIRPGLITRLDPVRACLLEEKVYGPRRKILIAEYAKYLQQPPPPGAAFDLMPNVADIADFDPFRDIIMSPELTTITASSFIPAFQQLPGFVPSWRAKIDGEFLDLIGFLANHGDSGKESGSDILQLATAVFDIYNHDLLMYPEVLLRPGFSSSGSCGHSRHDRFDVCRLRTQQFGCQTWSATRNKSFYPISVFEGAVAVVRAAGFDPKNTRREDMDRLDVRFACGVCSSPARKVVATWEFAIRHSWHLHRGLPGEIEWTLIEGDELANVKRYEETTYAVGSGSTVYCALCQHHIGDARLLGIILEHLVKTHGIPSDKAEEGTHYIHYHNTTSRRTMVLDRDGNVSLYVPA